MKTLRESLFDKDIVKNSDVKLGELYELSTVSHHNSFSNSPSKFIEVFDKKKLLKLKHHFVDLKNNFIEYWEKRGIDGLSSLIDCILCAPAQTFTAPNNVVCEKTLKNYLKPFISPKKYNDLFISIRRWSTSIVKDYMIDIQIYDNIMSSSSNSMDITIIKK